MVTVNVFAQDIFYDSDEPIYYIIEKDGVDYYLFNKPGDATSYDSYYYLFGIEYKDRKNESVYDNEVIQRAIQEGKNKPDKELTALIPSEIKYEDTIYAYDTKSADETVIIQGNLDNDENKEVILVIPTIDKDSKLLRAQFLQIYDRIDDHYKLIKTAHISQYPGVVVLKDLNGDGRQEIVAKGSNGMHLTEAYVYQWQDDNYKQIWHQEGDRGIQLLLDASPPVIKVGMAQWGTSSEPLWEVYQWDKDQFSLKP
ncbi:MAG: hypothetical protein K9L95_04945 [Candidatus Omnitrophica bacterium]|nr:hypothetical protein [Candidatus Omnitrophota bacterium]